MIRFFLCRYQNVKYSIDKIYIYILNWLNGEIYELELISKNIVIFFPFSLMNECMFLLFFFSLGPLNNKIQWELAYSFFRCRRCCWLNNINGSRHTASKQASKRASDLSKALEHILSCCCLLPAFEVMQHFTSRWSIALIAIYRQWMQCAVTFPRQIACRSIALWCGGDWPILSSIRMILSLYHVVVSFAQSMCACGAVVAVAAAGVMPNTNDNVCCSSFDFITIAMQFWCMKHSVTFSP